MSVHRSFADWYRSASVSPPEGLLEKRWVAVERVAKESDPATVLDLVRLFALSTSTERDVSDKFKDAFRAEDDAFPSKGNLLELRVLAGAVLRQIIEGGGDGAILPSLGIVCASFGPRAAALPEREHLVAAEQFLVTRATTIRERQDPIGVETKALSKARFLELIPADRFTANSLPGLQEPLLAALAEIGTTLASIGTQTQRSMDQLLHLIKSQDEELNILWWLQTAFSRHLSTPFDAIGWQAGVLVLPMEFADLVALLPGPDSAVAVLAYALQRAGVPDKAHVTVATAVNATPRDWRERMSTAHHLESVDAICPVLFALQKSLATERSGDWLPVYRKACDIRADKEVPALELAVQLYRERLLRAAFKMDES